MTDTSTDSANPATAAMVALLTPMFLSLTGNDHAQARATAIQTINAYVVSNFPDLLLLTQSVALGLAVLDSISLSMADNLPIPLILRLRANAASLHRAAEQCRRAVSAPEQDRIPPARPPTPPQDPPRSRAPDIQVSPDPAPAMINPGLAALQTESEQRIAQADAAMQQAGRPIPPASTPTRDPYRAAWSAAMSDVADEVTAGIDTLPPSERRAAGLRAAALRSTASHLIGGPPHQP